MGIGILWVGFLSGCDERPWNDPYPYEEASANTLYFAFTERPKHLDPARSYSASESPIVSQVYEPPLQYHYLKRPLVLEPLTASRMPEVRYYAVDGKEISEKDITQEVAYSDYIINIKPNIFYQPHPAFAKNDKGEYEYLNLSPKDAQTFSTLADFKKTGTREVVAEDYVYQIKRLADPAVSSPIFGLMSRYIEGLTELRETLQNAENRRQTEQDLRPFPLTGVEIIDRYTYRIRIKGKYPQFRFWLAMSFFAPMPWEAIQFYAQPGFLSHNLSLDWYPVGTGPFMLLENNPDRRMSLIKNPNFRVEFYPTEGESMDAEKGLLEDAGKRIPFVDKIIFTLEKEHLPYWNKFLQGYYDISGISSDNFNSAVGLTNQGRFEITPRLKKQGIRLQTSMAPNIFYWGFNMLDETVGGYSERARKLRKAISLVFDVKEYITLFANDRGVVATGPIPPDIFGFEVQPTEIGTNLMEAKKLLVEAGYKDGLTIYMDSIMTGGPDEIAMSAWLKEQFNKLNIQFRIRSSDYNRFQDKLRQGTTQIFFFGWSADYPDPENFLFLFYGPNGQAQFGGENSVNYHNEEYDRLFEKMRLLPDGPLRLNTIRAMVEILQKDTPWIWGVVPHSFALYQEWMRVSKQSGLIHNVLKYSKVNAPLRAKDRLHWNKPLLWPLIGLILLLVVLMLPVFYQYWRKQKSIQRR